MDPAALQNNTTGNQNTANGFSALSINSTGNNNTGYGTYALGSNSTGSSNTANGQQALYSNITGNFNTALGTFADVSTGALTNATAIGYSTVVNASNKVQIGNGSVTAVQLGTGSNVTLETGLIKLTGGAPGAGKVLTSDGVGLASWQAAAGGSGWNLLGNAATVDGANFIGTTDDIPFNIRVNNQKAGRIETINQNTFFGYQAGNVNTGIVNTATGTLAMFSNTTGSGNTANGANTLYSNITGSSNTANGMDALKNNTDGTTNTAVGRAALQLNTIGNYNTANGSSALQLNTIGNDNTANGQGALVNNSTGSGNTATGRSALSGNSVGSSNTAVGYQALRLNTGGSNNTALGTNADVSVGTLFNATAIGAFAVVNATNKIRLGSTGVTVIEGQVAYTFPSDGRFKTNISETDVKGLDFIKLLRPVVYNFDTKKFEGFLTKDMPDSVRQRYMNGDFTASTGIRQSGFIAQEVEKAAITSGYNFNGIHKPDNNNDHYSLAYSQFVVPLVKAVQEQQQMIEKQQQAINKQQEEIEALKKLVAGLVTDKK